MPRLFCLALLLGLVGPVPAQEPDDEEAARVRLVLETGGHTSRVMNLFFTPDGKQLVSVGRDRTVRFWDPTTGELRRTLHVQAHLPVDSGPQACPRTADGRQLLLNAGFKLKAGEKRPLVFVDLKEGRIDRQKSFEI